MQWTKWPLSTCKLAPLTAAALSAIESKRSEMVPFSKSKWEYYTITYISNLSIFARRSIFNWETILDCLTLCQKKLKTNTWMETKQSLCWHQMHKTYASNREATYVCLLKRLWIRLDVYRLKHTPSTHNNCIIMCFSFTNQFNGVSLCRMESTHRHIYAHRFRHVTGHNRIERKNEKEAVRMAVWYSVCLSRLGSNQIKMSKWKT